MHHPSPSLNAAICAMRGESNLHIILPALSNRIRAQVVALAPDTHPIVRVVAALHGNLSALIDAPDIDDPVLRDAVARFIGTPEGKNMLWTLSYVAPAGWGAVHADALMDAAQRRMCNAGVAAALIGPCDNAAALLHDAQDIAVALRHWGQSTPENPTAWMHALSAGQRVRALDALQRYLYAVARCMPWLPPDMACQTPIDDHVIDEALSAFAEASPTARALHAEIVQRMVAQANPNHLDTLTRLACALSSDEVWARVATLVQESPDAAAHVVAAAPWDDLDPTVRATILECADRSNVCAAVAAARGRGVAPRITSESATAFFAALDQKVWDAIPSDEQRRWRDALHRQAAHLAVRSIGLHPEILTAGLLYDPLITGAQRHAPNIAALRWALLPVALREVDPVDGYALMTALPTLPPDPGAFFFIVGGHADPSVIPAAHTTLQTLDNLALASVMQHCTGQGTPIQTRCAALHHALRRRTWDDLMPIMALLDNNARAILMPDLTVLVDRLAHPDRKESLSQTLNRLASLPPEVAVPTCVALTQATFLEASSVAEAIANALLAYGDVFLAMVDAIADNHLRTALLPLPDHDSQADALRALARDDPPSAQRMACALRNRDWRAATDIALSLPAHHRDALTPAANALVQRLTRSNQRKKMRQALDRLADLPPDGATLVRFALDYLALYSWDEHSARMAAEDVARALRAHGDVFLTIVDAIANAVLRNMLLPLPEDAVSANALRDLARDDPLAAHCLAHARRDYSWHAAIYVLLTAQQCHADAIWQTFAETERLAMASVIGAAPLIVESTNAGAGIAALALGAVQADNADMREAAIAALAARSDALRAIWLMLPQEMHQFLRSHPALSDLTGTLEAPSVRRFLRR